MKNKEIESWARDEFGDADLGDKRLNDRLISLCDRLSRSPESPINQACGDWSQSKAAYRFFKNPRIDSSSILEPHVSKTISRFEGHSTVLAIQDSSYIIYSSHPKTKGLGQISLKKGKNKDKIISSGLVMHSCMAVSTDGLPLGLLGQKIYARKFNTSEMNRLMNVTPIEEKESYRWLELLEMLDSYRCKARVVTVCDREADIYEFLELADRMNAPILVRANTNRAVNKRSRYSEKGVVKLWEFMNAKKAAGRIRLEIPASQKTKQKPRREARVANVEVRYGSFKLNPPVNSNGFRTGKHPDLEMHAVYVREINSPDNVDAIEWMLLTNIPIRNLDDAFEKVRWYALRWRIEMFHKVLKSGFNVERCRLNSAERLTRYLTLMSIIAVRMFMITLIARTSPELSCEKYLTTQQWSVLYLKIKRKSKLPKRVPRIGEVVVWIARLGGFLARKNDKMPGTIPLWRGWKRLNDLESGWCLALRHNTYG